MEKEKNIIVTQIILNSMVIIQMEKEVEKELNILKMEILNIQEIFVKEVIIVEKDVI